MKTWLSDTTSDKRCIELKAELNRDMLRPPFRNRLRSICHAPIRPSEHGVFEPEIGRWQNCPTKTKSIIRYEQISQTETKCIIEQLNWAFHRLRDSTSGHGASSPNLRIGKYFWGTLYTPSSSLGHEIPNLIFAEAHSVDGSKTSSHVEWKSVKQGRGESQIELAALALITSALQGRREKEYHHYLPGQNRGP